MIFYDFLILYFDFILFVSTYYIFRSMFGHFFPSYSYLCCSNNERQRKTDMAGKITSMNKIKQVLIMYRNGISNRKIASAPGIDKCT